MNLKKTFVRVVEAIVNKLHLRNYIVMELEEGRADNTGPLVRYMIEHQWTDRFRIAILSEHPERLRSLSGRRVSVLKRTANGKDTASGVNELLTKLRVFFVRARAALIADVTYPIRKVNSKTIHVYLTHGSPIKSLKKFPLLAPDTDYMLNQSDFWKQINSVEFGFPAEKMVTLGYPRNDELFSEKADLQKLFPGDYSKIVVWYPTFRHHINSKYRDGVAIPVIHDTDAAQKINEFASAYNILLVIKPHPYQDMSQIRALELSNVKLINDALFIENHISPYEFLGQTDALITDYSSVFFDYLLTGKPTALTFEDYEQYKEHQGFAIDTQIMTACSRMLETPQDFEAFFADLAVGRDPYAEERKRILRLTNRYTDDGSAQRVAEWMLGLLSRD